MLTSRLVHPSLLSALAAAGHGSMILLADGNFPHATAVGRGTTTVFLNIRPGLVTVLDLLPLICDVVAVESATVMAAPLGVVAPAHDEYRAALPAGTPMEAVDRAPFYGLTRSPDLAVAVATADMRLYANLLLTIGVANAS